MKLFNANHGNSFRIFLRKYTVLVVLPILFQCVGSFLPQRTSRWWNHQVGSPGAPISQEEKRIAMQMPLLPVSPHSNRYLESPRLFEGDIYMNPNIQLPRRNENRRGVLKGLHTWPDGEVKYTIENTFDENERLHVARAMAEIETRSCVRFVPRSDEINFMYIHKGKDCASSVGVTGGGQPLSLAPKCVQYGIILHELLHALGFWHEQSRYDRRSYVNIHWFNIKPLMLPNFLVTPYYFMSDVGLPYDYDSILHYSTNSFARNPDRPTISPKEDGIQIGQRKGLSKLNTESINLLYNCGDVNYQDLAASGSHYEHQRELYDNNDCLDLWVFCYGPKIIGGCWWGDYLMRRYCRKSCGLCS